MKDEQEGKQ
jgi:hypothetical protein